MLYYRRHIAKWICYGLTVWLLLVLQTMALPRFRLLGGYGLPAVAAVAALAVLEGQRGGAAVGFFCGAVIDAMTPAVEAYFTLFLLMAGYVAGLAATHYFQKTVWTALLWGAGLTALMEFLYFFLFFYLTGRAGWRALIEAGLPELLLTLPMLPPVYGIFRLLHNRFVKD